MKRLKHTPGPWEAQKSGESGADDVYDVIHPNHPGYDPSQGETYAVAEYLCEADAALVAAAPDLLSACRLALGSLHAAGFENATVKAVEAAIAKAEGRGL